MTALVTAVFVASLLGSLHCAGMCGGIVALCVGMDPMRQRRVWPLHAAYNGGRLVTYSALGAVSGSIGAAFDLGGAALGVQRGAAMLAGAAMIVFGVITLLRLRGVSLGCRQLPGAIDAVYRRGLRAATTRPPVVRAGLIGLLTGFLPCGWLYAFVVTAAGTGSAALGALTMAVFWSGTLPVMLSLGVGLQKLTGPLRRHLPTVTALVLVMVGAVTVFGRLQVPAYAGPPPVTADESLAGVVERVETLSSSDMPCCNDDDDHRQPDPAR